MKYHKETIAEKRKKAEPAAHVGRENMPGGKAEIGPPDKAGEGG